MRTQLEQCRTEFDSVRILFRGPFDTLVPLSGTNEFLGRIALHQGPSTPRALKAIPSDIAGRTARTFLCTCALLARGDSILSWQLAARSAPLEHVCCHRCNREFEA